MGIAVSGLLLFNQKPQQGFGIFLSQNNQVVLTDEDVVWYNRSSHQMNLTGQGKNKLEELAIDLRGTPFTVKLNGKELYKGSFWAPISSMSSSGIVIEVWRDQNTVVKIQNGYPSSQFFTSADLRDNSKLIEHFQEMGKLVQ